MLTEKYTRLGLDADTVEKEVMADILNDFEQGFRAGNTSSSTVASSRGDYPFITMTMGTGTGRFAKLASITMLNVRRKVRSQKGQKKPVLFRIVFCMTKICTDPASRSRTYSKPASCARPRNVSADWLSLTRPGYVPVSVQKYARSSARWAAARSFLVVRAGGMKPADENDKPLLSAAGTLVRYRCTCR